VDHKTEIRLSLGRFLARFSSSDDSHLPGQLNPANRSQTSQQRAQNKSQKPDRSKLGSHADSNQSRQCSPS